MYSNFKLPLKNNNWMDLCVTDEINILYVHLEGYPYQVTLSEIQVSLVKQLKKILLMYKEAVCILHQLHTFS